MLSENSEPQINFDSIQAVSEPRSRLQLLFALALLLAALVLVVLKNRQFWFDALGLEEVRDQTTFETIKKGDQRVNLTPSRKTGARQTVLTTTEGSSGVIDESRKTVLSPLQVDVKYSSGEHKTLVARSSTIHIDLQQNPQPSSVMRAGAGSTGVQVRFSGQTGQILGRPVEPVYPLTAQQAHVQGSVVLQARIGEDGNVQALQVISGPTILTTAALEAVKQWKFKPRYEGGKAIPAEALITVNFTISTQ